MTTEDTMCRMNEDDFPLTFGEALKAMIDGEVVMDSRMQSPTRFNVKEQAFQYYKNYNWYSWDIKYTDRSMQRWKVIEFVEEYSLTFAEAFKHMLDGEKTVCRNAGNAHIGFNGKHFTVTDKLCGKLDAPTDITAEMQIDYKWKVVE